MAFEREQGDLARVETHTAVKWAPMPPLEMQPQPWADQQTQANRGDALKVLQQPGYDVQLVRCGKLYQLSTAKWYRVAGPSKRPVMMLRNVRCDTAACPKGQENYTLALEGKLPQLQQGEVEAVGGRSPGR